MLTWLRNRLRRRNNPAREDGPPDHQGGGAHPSGETPAPLHYGRRRLKETYTRHWDLDYLPREEVERRLREQNRG